MGKFDGFLMCSDVDGTLTNSKGEISKENLEAIKYFQKNGGKFTISTGRFPEYIKNYFKVFSPNCPAVVANGGILYDYINDKIIKSESLLEDLIDLIEFFWYNMPQVNQIGFSDENECTFNLVKDKNAFLDNYFKNVIEIKSLDWLKNIYNENKHNITRMFFIMSEDKLMESYAKLKSKFSDKFELFPSWKEGIECMPFGINKGKMVLELKKYLGDIHTTVCVGDYDNDISMLKIADISYAVENAPQRVKDYATKIAPEHNQSAIKYIINNLLIEKGEVL